MAVTLKGEELFIDDTVELVWPYDCPFCAETLHPQISDERTESLSENDIYLDWYCNGCWASFGVKLGPIKVRVYGPPEEDDL